MKNFFKELLSSKGSISSMRLVFIAMNFLIIVLTAITLFREDSIQALALFSGMFTVVAGGKLLQKREEVKDTQHERTTTTIVTNSTSPSNTTEGVQQKRTG